MALCTASPLVAVAAQDTARSQQVFKRMFPDNKVGTAIDTSQAVKQANISTEADNRKKKVAGAAKGKAAKPAPRKAGAGKTGSAVKSKSKPAGKPKKK